MTTIVLIPGAGGDSYYWHLVAPRLEEHGFRVIAVDLPAADDSAGIPEYAEAVMGALGDPTDVVVVAQSLGAFTAVEVAERIPVSLIVFVAAMIPAPGETSGQWWEATSQSAAQRALDLREGRDPDAPFDVMVTYFHDVPPDVVDRLFERGDPAQSGRPLESANRATAWRTIPIRVIAGSRDRLFPIDFVRRLSRERVGVDPVEIDGGHLLALSRPEELADVIASSISEAEGGGLTDQARLDDGRPRD
jgi:pimeloyl-ACP methyl ester carboxylesterase